MAIANYADLKRSVANSLDNNTLASETDDFIAVSEARFNRILRDPQMETRTTLTVGGSAVDSIALPSDNLELREVHIEAATDKPLSYRSPQFIETVRSQLTGDPVFYSVEQQLLTFAAQAPAAMAFSVLYFQKIPALTKSNTTNWLMTTYPDIYLYSTMMQAELLAVNVERAAGWKQLLDEAMSEVRQASDLTRLGAESTTRRRSQRGPV